MSGGGGGGGGRPVQCGASGADRCGDDSERYGVCRERRTRTHPTTSGGRGVTDVGWISPII